MHGVGLAAAIAEKRKRVRLEARLLLLLGTLLCGLGPETFAQNSQPILRTAEAVRELSHSESSMGQPVDVTGIVISRIRSRQMVFLKVGEHTLSAYAPGTNIMVEAGQEIRLQGFTGGQEGMQIVAREISVQQNGLDIPEPRKMRVSQIETLPDPVHWLEVFGTVKHLTVNRGRLRGVLRQAGQTLNFMVLAPSTGKPSDYLYSQIRLRGVLLDFSQLGYNQEGRVLWIGSRSNVTFETQYPKNPFNRGRKTVATLKGIHPNGLWEFRPRIEATVVSVDAENGEIVVKDDTGEIKVQPVERHPVRVGDIINAVGFIEHDDQDGIYLGSAEIQLRAPPGVVTSSDEVTPVPVITAVEPLRELKPVEMLDHPPVRLQGVITYHDPVSHTTFLQDGAAGIRILPPAGATNLHIGANVQLDGYAEMSGLSPQVVASTLQVTGTNSLPEPEIGNAGSMMVGRMDGTYILAEGIVRSARVQGDKLRLRLNRFGPIFPVIMNGGEQTDPSTYVDSRVEIRGVAQALVNRQGHVVGSRILTAGPEQIRILSPSPEAPFKINARKVSDFKTFRQVDSHLRRNRMTGVVTLSWPGKMYVQDDTGSLEVKLSGAPSARVGDRVTVIGFPVLGSTRPMIEDADVKILGRAPVPDAIHTHAERILTSEMNGRRAILDGILLSKTQGVREFVLMLLDGDITVPVVLRRRIGPMDLEQFETGSRIQVTGICELNESEDRNSRDVRLLVDSAKHIELMAAPPWWTLPRLLGAIGGMACILIASFWWVAFLQRRVTQTQNRFATAFKASPIPVAILTREGHVVLDVNDSFVSQFAYKRRDVLSRRLDDAGIALDGQFMERTRRQLETQTSLRGLEFRLRTGDGKERIVLLSVELIDVDGDEALLLIFQDITERFNLMNQLRESQKMEAVGQLAAGVAHDFNNLLTILRGNCDLLADVAGENGELQEIQSEMDAATLRATDLTRQLLAFSRKQIMQPRIVDLNDVVNAAMKMLRRLLGEEVTVTSDLHAGEQTIFADAGMLDQILVNLAVNARDAMPNGGEVSFSTSLVELGEEDIPEHPEGQIGPHVTLSVTDTGEGMDGDTRKHIFEPFFTTKEVGKGTGLGLATVFGIMKQHRGWIEVQSKPGRGTTFTAWFPLATDREESETVVVTKEEVLEGSETILVVEDEEALRRMIARTLGRFGYTVHVAENGLDGRAVWEQHGADIDLLVTDMMMPGGINGLELSKEFLTDRPNLKTLYISGYSPDLVQADHELDVGVNFLPKPFTNKALLETVRRRLARRPDSISAT